MKKKLIALCTAAVLCLSMLSACGSKDSEGGSPSAAPDKNADLSAFAQTVQENHEFASLEKADPSDAEVGAIMLENSYPGLKSAEDAAKVKEIFQARIDSKSTEGVGNYPEEVEMWLRSAKLAESGNYVMLVCHDDADAIVSEFNALFA